MVNLTMNFTGAGIKKLFSLFKSVLIKKIYYQIKQSSDRIEQPRIDDNLIIRSINKIALEYKIIFGSRTLPELVQINKEKQKYLTIEFLQKM